MVLDKNEMVNWIEEQDSKEIIEISKKLISHSVILKITLPTLKQTVEVKVHYKVKLKILQ